MPFPTYEARTHATGLRARHHQDVQYRAYYLWEHASRPEGMRTADESWREYFWKAAEHQATAAELWSAVVNCAGSLC